MPPIDLVYLNGPDIALGCAMLDKAQRLGLGQTLRFQ